MKRTDQRSLIQHYCCYTRTCLVLKPNYIYCCSNDIVNVTYNGSTLVTNPHFAERDN